MAFAQDVAKILGTSKKENAQAVVILAQRWDIKLLRHMDEEQRERVECNIYLKLEDTQRINSTREEERPRIKYIE